MQKAASVWESYNGMSIYKMGPLAKEGNVSSIFKLEGRWRMRWVALTDAALFYWKDETDFRSGKPHKLSLIHI